MVRITFRRVAHREPQPLPAYRTVGSSGMDLHAAGGVSIEPGARALVPTGFAVAIPAGYEAQVRPRSGLAARSGLTVLNAPGTIDSDYRGEVMVLLVNLGQDRVDIRPGERIAQMVIAPVARAETEIGDELPPTGRGAGGFGSTGT